MYSKPIQNLIFAFKKLPGVGQRTAERFVFHLLKSGKKDVATITLALRELIETVKSCPMCWDFSDTAPCKICSDTKRNSSLLCVVENSQDIQSVEKIGLYTGRYHVLRGTVSPEDPAGFESTKTKELLTRIESEPIQEIIFALNQNLAGETTTLFLTNQIKQKKPNLIMSRLARGLPMGSDIEYADEITLENAFQNRIIQK